MAACRLYTPHSTPALRRPYGDSESGTETDHTWETAMNRLTITTLIIATGLGCQLANAVPPEDAPAVTVQFADLDVTHSDGVARLYGRLQAAAERVCASHDGRIGSDIASQARYKSCRQSALATAVAKVDQPALTAYYRAQVAGRSAAVQIAKH